MFNLSKDEITFEKVKEFCEEWQEGVRVEYKSQIHKAMPKTLSSFANTQGGILIIGVETDKTHNKVKFPIEGIPKEPGIEERIVQSGLTGINPPVMPEVLPPIDVPETENVVIVVRVEESVQAPHAIQDSTMVYERVASVSQPYELKLANIERIEYLLNRRQEPQRDAQQLLARIDSSRKLLSEASVPNMRIIARPVFPYRPVISHGKISDLFIDRYGSRRVPGGICIESAGQSPGRITQFHENGIVYHKEELGENDTDRTLTFYVFLSVFYNFMDYAKDFYSGCDYSGNIEVSAEIKNVQDMIFSTVFEDFHVGPLCGECRCAVPEFRVTTPTCYFAQDFRKPETRKSISEELLWKILCAFNVPIGKKEVIRYVQHRIASAIK